MDGSTQQKGKSKFFLIYGSQFFFMYAVYGLTGTTLMIHLTDVLGLGYSTASSIISVGMLICIFFLPIVGIFADKTKKHTLIFKLIVSMGLIVTFLYTFDMGVLFIFIVGVLFQIFRSTLISLDDSIVSVEAAKYGYSYSNIRVIGSSGYIIGGLVGGVIYDITGSTVSCFYAGMVSFLISLVIAILFYPKKLDVSNEKRNFSVKHDLPVVLKNPYYIFIVLAVCLSYGVSDSSVQFAQSHLLTLDIPEKQLGLVYLCTSIFEIVLLPIMSIIIYRLGIIKCLRIALAACTIRMIMSGYTDSYTVFLLFLTLHGVTLAFGLPVIIFFINKFIDKEVNSSAILIYGALFTGTKSLNVFITGLLLDKGIDMSSIFIVTGIIVGLVFFASLFVKEPAEN